MTFPFDSLSISRASLTRNDLRVGNKILTILSSFVAPGPSLDHALLKFLSESGNVSSNEVELIPIAPCIEILTVRRPLLPEVS